MDSDAEIQKAQSEHDYVVGWATHPLTVAFRSEAKEAQETLIDLICRVPVTDVASFFAHFEATGHLHGLRQLDEIVQEKVREQKQKLKEAQENGN